MTHPEQIYYAALVLIGLPAALHAGMARVLVAVGVAACLAWLAGLFPGPLTPRVYLAIHVVAIITAIKCCRVGARCLTAISLFVDLIIIDVFEFFGLFTAHDAWWARWWLVLAQLLLLSPEAWESIRRAVRWTCAPILQSDRLHLEPVA